METNEDILDILFNEKEENDLFNISNFDGKELGKKISISDEKLTEFIQKRIHQKSRSQLQNLINQYSSSLENYSNVERRFCYKSGFSDGVKAMIAVFYHK